MNSSESKCLAQQFIDKYGPTLGGVTLYAALGFKTYAAFYRRQQRGELGVRVFTLPSRRGWFAITREVAVWLEQQAELNVDGHQNSSDSKK